MRNFLAFIRRFRVLLFFALLQGLALTIYFTFSQFPRTQYLTTASAVNGQVMTARNEVTKHFSLNESNKKLQQENAMLREMLKENKLITMHPDHLDSIPYGKTDTVQHFEYVPGMVINSTYTKRNNYFTLNIGESHGIKRGMGVVSDKGIVGVVHNTSSHFAVVKSCLTEDLNVTVMIEATGEPGLLKWDGHNPRVGNMTGVSNDTKIKKWSKVVTRGGAGIFPRGIPVGKVKSTTVIEGQPLWNVRVLFAENFRSVHYVHVLKNLLLDEQQGLEAQIPEDPVE